MKPVQQKERNWCDCSGVPFTPIQTCYHSSLQHILQPFSMQSILWPCRAMFANLTLLHCRPPHWGSSFSAARLNAAVCCLCLERWWLGPLHFLMFILRHDKSKFVVHQKFPVERMTGSCLVMFTWNTLMAAILRMYLLM